MSRRRRRRRRRIRLGSRGNTKRLWLSRQSERLTPRWYSTSRRLIRRVRLWVIRRLLLHADRTRRFSLREVQSLPITSIAGVTAFLLLWVQREVVEPRGARRNLSNRGMRRGCRRRRRRLLRDANMLLRRRRHRALRRGGLWLPLLILVSRRNRWSERVIMW